MSDINMAQKIKQAEIITGATSLDENLAEFYKESIKDIEEIQVYAAKELLEKEKLKSKIDNLSQEIYRLKSKGEYAQANKLLLDYQSNNAEKIEPLPNGINSGLAAKASYALEHCKIHEKIKLKIAQYAANGKVELSGVSTSYQKLDSLIDGFQAGHLITLAGRTGMGKSWIALNLLKNIAIDQNIPATLFSLEMSNTQVLKRLISLMSDIPCKKIMDGTMNGEQIIEVEKAISVINESQLYISEDPANSQLEKLSENIRHACFTNKSKLIVIDHIGLVKSPARTENRINEVAEITRTIKIAAKKYNVPIICLAQLNRSATKEDERPKMSQIRESGAIEQDSDLIILIYRANYWDKTKEPIVEIIVDKNRDGEENTIQFHCNDNWLLSEINNNSNHPVIIKF